MIMKVTRSVPDAPPARTVSVDVALLIMVLIWAVNFSVAKQALRELSPLAFNALRFPLASATVLVALRWRGALRLPARRDLGRVLALGLLGNVVYQLLFILGLANTGAGTASVLLAASPVATAALSGWLGHERITTRVWVGLAGTVLGIALLVTGGDPVVAGENHLLGDGLMVAASVAWALYTVGSRDLVRRYGSITLTAWTLWAGTLGLCLIGLPAVLATDLGSISVSAWLAVAYAGALSIGIAYLIWYYGVQRIGSTRTAVYGNLVAAGALLVAWLWLGETPSVQQLLGAAVIITGVTATRARGPVRQD